MDLFSDISWSFSYGDAFAFTTLILAYLAGHSAARINRKNKIADVVMHCIERYDAIARDKLQVRTKHEAVGYMRRYFGLKSDQFDYWLSGMVDAENISSWTYSVLDAFENEKSVLYWEEEKEKSITLEEGWQLVRKSHNAPNATFVTLIDDVLSLSKAQGLRHEKYYQLIGMLARIEEVERDFIGFADVTFIMRRIRSENMRAFQRMEKRHARRVEKYARGKS